MKTGLTETQYQTFVWVKEFIKRNGWSPSIGEVAEKFDISASAAADRINGIVERGYLEKDENKSRTLRVKE